jgi:hypothetical protein
MPNRCAELTCNSGKKLRSDKWWTASATSKNLYIYHSTSNWTASSILAPQITCALGCDVLWGALVVSNIGVGWRNRQANYYCTWCRTIPVWRREPRELPVDRLMPSISNRVHHVGYHAHLMHNSLWVTSTLLSLSFSSRRRFPNLIHELCWTMRESRTASLRAPLYPLHCE